MEEKILFKPLILLRIWFSILVTASLTCSSVSPKISNSIGESNDGPPSSASISTVIPGKSLVDSFKRSIISKPEIFVWEGSNVSIKPPPTLSEPDSHQFEPDLRYTFFIPSTSINLSSTCSMISFVSSAEKLPRALMVTFACIGSTIAK